jgi:hypothetical protein
VTTVFGAAILIYIGIVKESLLCYDYNFFPFFVHFNILARYNLFKFWKGEVHSLWPWHNNLKINTGHLLTMTQTCAYSFSSYWSGKDLTAFDLRVNRGHLLVKNSIFNSNHVIEQKSKFLKDRQTNTIICQLIKTSRVCFALLNIFFLN